MDLHLDSSSSPNNSIYTAVNTSENSTDYHISIELDVLNSREAVRRLPVVVFVSILILIGIFGNAHVLYIYFTKFSHSTYRIFVLSLAAVDMTSCCISMPFEIADELNPYMFDNAVACKIFRFLNTLLAMATAVMLVVIASERYRKICKPYGNQMSDKQSKYALFGVMCFAFISTIPALYMYGNKTVNIPGHKDLKGTECTWADYVEGTAVSYAYFAWGIMVILTCMVLLIILYSFVGIHLRTHTIKVQSTIRIKSRRRTKKRSRRTLIKSQDVKSTSSKVSERLESKDIAGRKSVQSEQSNCSLISVSELKLPSSPNGKTNSTNIRTTLGTNNYTKPVVEANSAVIQKTMDTSVSSIEGNRNSIGSSLSSKEGKGVNKNDGNRLSTNSFLTVSNSYSRDSQNETSREYLSDVETKTMIMDPNANPESKTINRRGGTIMRKTKTFISDREQRITKVLFTITLLFVLSFLPYIIILVVYSADASYEDKLSPAAYIVYLIGLRLYFINNVANSLLYISFDLKFRKHFIIIHKRILIRRILDLNLFGESNKVNKQVSKP